MGGETRFGKVKVKVTITNKKNMMRTVKVKITITAIMNMMKIGKLHVKRMMKIAGKKSKT